MQTVTEFNVREIEKSYAIFEAELKKFTNDTGRISITRDEFTNILPEFSKTEAKLKVIDKMPTMLSNANVVTYFKKQTMGKDFINFKFLIKELGLSKDRSGMIVFSRSLKHINVKKEALFIWWIMDFVNNHPFLRRYRGNVIFDAKLQESFDSIISGKRSKKFDLVFTNFNITVEIDENHNIEVVLNDNAKDYLAKMNGNKLIRLSVPYMFEGISYENEPGDAGNLMKFKAELEHTLIIALVRSKEYRKEYIMFMFRKGILDDIEKMNKRIESHVNYIEKNINASNIEDELTRLQGLQNYIKDKKELMESLDSDKIINMFEFKESSKNKKNITFEQIHNLFKFIDKDYLYKFIIGLGLFDENDRISWKDLSIIITKIDINDKINTNDKIYKYRNVLAEYYAEIELLYESIVDGIVTFYEDIVSNPENYQNYAKFMEENKFDTVEKDLKKANDKIKQLNIENKNYKDKLSYYEKRNEANKIVSATIARKTDHCTGILDKVKFIEYDFHNIYAENREIFSVDVKNTKENIIDLINSLKDTYKDAYITDRSNFESENYDRNIEDSNKEKIINQKIKDNNKRYKNIIKKIKSINDGSHSDSDTDTDTDTNDRVKDELN